MKEITFAIYKCGRGTQLSIEDDSGGYRILGPKFTGDSILVTRSKPISDRDILELQRYLDKAKLERDA